MIFRIFMYSPTYHDVAETMGSRSRGDELLTFTSALLVTNVVIDILTFCGTMADSILLLNIFIMVEGLSIAVFLLRNFSPIVVLRLVVLFLAAQIRSRIKGVLCDTHVVVSVPSYVFYLSTDIEICMARATTDMIK